MAKNVLVAATDVNSEGWETATFPLVCETCLGDNPYVRMVRAPISKECKICSRPYTSFRWQPGRKARYKTTIVCQTCAKLKNVCQVCLFDLEYGLPVQVRDKFLEESQRVELPQCQVNRDWALNNMDPAELPYNKSVNAHPMLLKLARSQPYYKRNRARVCTFWQRGECTRGDSCPYRHENDEDNDPSLANQNIRDRFLGVDDPVANKILQNMNEPKEESGQESGQEQSQSSGSQASGMPSGLPPGFPAGIPFPPNMNFQFPFPPCFAIPPLPSGPPSSTPAPPPPSAPGPSTPAPPEASSSS